MNPELVGQLNIVSQIRGGILTLPETFNDVGIESIVFNDDGSMTIVLTDGSSYTSPSLIGPGVAPGGTTGQVLAKATDNDYETEWVDPGVQELPIATKEALGGIIVGNDLLVTDNGVLSVDKATAVQEDNTKPITAAAVYVEIGNINAALATI